MFNFPMVRRSKADSLLNIDNLFDEFFKAPIRFGLGGFDSLPSVDIYEKGNNIIVKAEIPGVKPEELNISVDEDFLTLSGEKKQENELKEKDYYRLERAFGRFERTVKLPGAVKAEDSKATYKNGVVRIELPKSEQTRKKKIKIELN